MNLDNLRWLGSRPISNHIGISNDLYSRPHLLCRFNYYYSYILIYFDKFRNESIDVDALFDWDSIKKRPKGGESNGRVGTGVGRVRVRRVHEQPSHGLIENLSAGSPADTNFFINTLAGEDINDIYT